jgi:hypothetical protein
MLPKNKKNKTIGPELRSDLGEAPPSSQVSSRSLITLAKITSSSLNLWIDFQCSSVSKNGGMKA